MSSCDHFDLIERALHVWEIDNCGWGSKETFDYITHDIARSSRCASLH